MVRSIFDKSVNFPESQLLDSDDLNYDAPVYDTIIKNIKVTIALGKAKYTFKYKNIIYYPIYLVKNKKVEAQLGLFEVLANKIQSLKDLDGDLNIGELHAPLYYSFVNQSFIKDKLRNVEQTNRKEDVKEADEEPQLDEEPQQDEEPQLDEEPQQDEEAQQDEDKESERVLDDTNDSDRENILKLQTADNAKQEREEYIYTKEQVWVQQYMKNNNYDLIDNEGGGECLFASIRDGLRQVDINISVNELRKKLVEYANKEVFSMYKTNYTEAISNYKLLDKQVKQLKSQHGELKKKKEEADKKSDISLASTYVEQSDIIAQEYNETRREKALAKELVEEFKMMKGIKTLPEFHALIQTCKFWGDTWAISTLEKALNIKLILFSQGAFNNKDYDNVLQCGQLNDEDLEKKGIFKPDYYLILNHQLNPLGDHYLLVSYKNHTAFKYTELPYDIRKMIVEKCLEKQSGPYYLIEDFRKFAEELNTKIDDEGDGIDIDRNDLYKASSAELQFYKNSYSRPKPGFGSGENLGIDGISSYNLLASIPDWRKKLSDFWKQEFMLDNRKWLSIEHYYQASKFKKNNKDFYHKFSLDSDSDISKNPELAYDLGGKTGHHRGERVRPKNIQIDPDFYSGRNKIEKYEALKAKFTQNKDLKKMLLATKDSKLKRFRRNMKPELASELMKVRKELLIQ